MIPSYFCIGLIETERILWPVVVIYIVPTYGALRNYVFPSNWRGRVCAFLIMCLRYTNWISNTVIAFILSLNLLGKPSLMRSWTDSDELMMHGIENLKYYSSIYFVVILLHGILAQMFVYIIHHACTMFAICQCMRRLFHFFAFIKLKLDLAEVF